ncbi:MAG: hypothetical protein ACRDD1_14610, partial [Planctomycetia bacterium]
MLRSTWLNLEKLEDRDTPSVSSPLDEWRFVGPREQTQEMWTPPDEPVNEIAPPFNDGAGPVEPPFLDPPYVEPEPLNSQEEGRDRFQNGVLKGLVPAKDLRLEGGSPLPASVDRFRMTAPPPGAALGGRLAVAIHHNPGDEVPGIVRADDA